MSMTVKIIIAIFCLKQKQKYMILVSFSKEIEE